MTLITYLFFNLRTAKEWLDECLKSPALEHTSTVNILQGAKHYSDLYVRTFIKLFNHPEGN